MRALVLPVGADLYAVPMTSVREVVSRPPSTSVPTAPKSVVGVFNLRGEIVPLFDTSQLLGTPTPDAVTHTAVVLTAAGPAGLVATGAPEVRELGDPIGPAELPASVAAYADDRRLVTLLDVDVLLAPARGQD